MGRCLHECKATHSVLALISLLSLVNMAKFLAILSDMSWALGQSLVSTWQCFIGVRGQHESTIKASRQVNDKYHNHMHMDLVPSMLHQICRTVQQSSTRYEWIWQADHLSAMMPQACKDDMGGCAFMIHATPDECISMGLNIILVITLVHYFVLCPMLTAV